VAHAVAAAVEAVRARGAVAAGAAAAVAAAAAAAAGAVDMRTRRTIEHPMETMMQAHRSNAHRRSLGWLRLTLALFAAVFAAVAAHAAAPAQKTFGSPEDAASALVQALKAHDRAAMLAVLGNAGEWISSGDATADRAAADKFVADYEKKHSIARDGDKATLVVGDEDYPFAFPIVKQGDAWHYDTAAGKEELLARRIGQNELDAIKVLQAIGDAQRDYASADRNGDGVLDYAQKFASSPGKHDGLYWPTNAGEPASPLGPLVAYATGQGYKKNEKGSPSPFHGYFYRMLKGQGKSAEGGALDYVVKGRQIGGYAVIAYPAKYGNSGIMTFMVNQDGKVYQADLGPATQAKAGKIQVFDPGEGWAAVAPK